MERSLYHETYIDSDFLTLKEEVGLETIKFFLIYTQSLILSQVSQVHFYLNLRKAFSKSFWNNLICMSKCCNEQNFDECIGKDPSN